MAVVDAGSIAAAARALDVAPTTIAQQIRALEKVVGCSLLVRSGHTVKATSAGHRILGRARHVVREVHDMCVVATTHDLPPGPLRLGATHSALMGLLPLALKIWNNSYPEIGVFIRPGDSVPLLNQVAEGEIDAAIIGDPLFQIPKSCGWDLLSDEDLVLVTPIAMSIADPLGAIIKGPFIRFDRSYTVGRLVDNFLRQHKIEPNSNLELDGIEVIANFVGEGLGISVLPKCPYVLRRDSGVKWWPLPKPFPSRRVGFAWSRSSVRFPLAIAMKNILKNDIVRAQSCF